MKVMSIITYQTRKTSFKCSSSENKLRYFWWNLFNEMFDETMVLLMWNDMRVIKDKMSTSKYFLWVFLKCKIRFHELRVSFVRMAIFSVINLNTDWSNLRKVITIIYSLLLLYGVFNIFACLWMYYCIRCISSALCILWKLKCMIL